MGDEERAALLGGLSAEEMEAIIGVVDEGADHFSEGMGRVARAADDAGAGLDEVASATDRAYHAFDVLTRYLGKEALEAFGTFAKIFLENENLTDQDRAYIEELAGLAEGGLTEEERERWREIGRTSA